MPWRLYGRVVESCYPGLVGVVGRGLRTFDTKQAARAAKHRAIRAQLDEPRRPTTYRFFVKRVLG